MMERIYLVGYRCTGKTTVGRLLARDLEWAFCGMDRMIEDHAGTSIESIFEKEGEETFRRLEEEMLTRCSSVPEAVVSTGGGVVTRPDNRDILNETGRVIWLRAGVETIRDRMRSDMEEGKNRPPIRGSSAVAEVKDLLDERRPLYEDVADEQIQTDDQTPEDLSGQILGRFS